MDAVEKVGADRKKVKAEVNRTKGHKALIGEINFDDHRQNIVTANVYVVRDGKWVYWPDSDYSVMIATVETVSTTVGLVRSNASALRPAL